MKIFETNDIIGSYRIVRPLGTGGMGMVYEVEHTKLKIHRALKVFAVENENVELHRKRFLSEGKMLSALDHPRVIRVHEFEVDAQSGLPYFVMELVLSPDGTPRTLEDERRSGMDESQAARWFADICEGLDYVHSLGIVHRDVKLENVLIGPDGRAILSDFGISRIFDDELRQRLDITLTMPQDEKVLNCLGSVHYLAPELQGANPEKATTYSDAWALGILLFRLLTGFWFESENREKCLKILEDYNFKWSPLVNRLCAVNPAERIPVDGFNKLAPIASEVSAPPPKRLGWLWGAVAALVVAVGVGGYFALSPVQPPIADNDPNELESMNLGLHVSVDFTDLQLMNNGEPVLIPGVAAETKFLSLAWDEEVLTNTLAKVSGDPIPALIQSARPYPANPVRGIRVEILRPDALLANRQEEAEQSRIFKELSPTNLASMLVQLEPTSDFSSTSNCCLTAELKYDSPSYGVEAVTWLRSLTEGLDPSPITNAIEATNGTVRIAMTYRCDEGGKIVGQVVMKAIMLNSDAVGDSHISAAKRNYEVVQIAKEQQAAILKAEKDYTRRQFYDPVVKALEGESETNRVAWAGISQTAEDMLDSLTGGSVFRSYREYLGRGALTAYDKGCLYPVPIAYAYSSYFRKKEEIQTVNQRILDALEKDVRWNAASRLAFISILGIEDNTPASVTNFAERESIEIKRFLQESDWATNELGAVYQLLRGLPRIDVSPIIAEVEAEGVKIDLWLKTMMEADDAHTRAWDARGKGFANTVTKAGWQIYNREIAKVLPLLEKAYRLRPDLPQSGMLALMTCYGDREEMDKWLKRVQASRYDYCLAYSAYFWGLRPRWGGSIEAMVGFLLSIVNDQNFESMVPIWAYQSLVNYVFQSEGGVTLERGRFPTVARFLERERESFERYFNGYRQSAYAQNASCAERAQIFVTLADLAWRIGNLDEFLYWTDRMEKHGMPPFHTYFGDGYGQYYRYLRSIRSLEGERRNTYFMGVRALHTDGDADAIGRMVKIANEIGEHNLALTSVLARRGTADLRPFVRDYGTGRQKQFRLPFSTHVRDHMIFRVGLRSGTIGKRSAFTWRLAAESPYSDDKGDDIDIRVERGGISNRGNPLWPEWEETCVFELEIVGTEVRLTQGGARIWTKRFATRPSVSRGFSSSGTSESENLVEKFELETRDDMNFVIESVFSSSPEVSDPRPSSPTMPVAKMIGGVEPVVNWQGRPDWSDALRIVNAHILYAAQKRQIELNQTNSVVQVRLPVGGLDAFTVIFDYCNFGEKPLKDDFIICGISTKQQDLDGNSHGRERMMVKGDPKTGLVAAVAEGNVARWFGKVPMNLKSPYGTFAVSYDYAHGLNAYQRVHTDKPWTKLVSSIQCRYRNEKPSVLCLGTPLNIYTHENGLEGMRIRSIVVYPKVLTPEELRAF